MSQLLHWALLLHTPTRWPFLNEGIASGGTCVISTISKESNMGDLLIRGIPDPLKREIESAAKKKGRSLSAQAIDLLRKGVVAEKKEASSASGISAWSVIRQAVEAEAGVDEEFVEVLTSIERERKRDFGRESDGPT
jgi:plasmid stability protein